MTRALAPALSLLLAITLLVCPASAAESADKPAENVEHIKVQGYLDIASELFAAKDYEGALGELKRALALEDLAIVRFNIARCCEELGRSGEAVKAYRDYLKVVDATAGADVRDERAKKAIAELTQGPPEPTMPKDVPLPEGSYWKYLRADDCGGEQLGASEGAAPVAERCTAADKGHTALCWDGTEKRNPALKEAGCVYKSVLPALCRGGTHSAFLYECASASAASAPRADPTAPPPPKIAAPAATPAATPAKPSATAAAKPSPPRTGPATRLDWVYVGPGDCAASDASTSKGAVPVSSRCDSNKAGATAVCWDGISQHHPTLKGAACTYKTVKAETCKGGPTPGLVYRCGP